MTNEEKNECRCESNMCEERITEAAAEVEASGAADETERLREENAQLFARLQRVQADFDNYRKRVKAERQEWSTAALAEFIKELLPVVDNLERALQAGGTAESLHAGVDMVYRQLLSVLEKQGVSAIEACGLPFDPNFHHAVLQVECDSDENTVVEELQKGYCLKEKVLRPSMVKVAR